MAEQQKLPIIFVLGPPGAGKSYLCDKAEETIPGVKHIVMSTLLSEEMNKFDSPWAQEIKDKMPHGVHVSSAVSTAVLEAWYKSLPNDHKNTYLLDGFPRNIEQASAFPAKLGAVNATISLTCPQAILWERTAKRAREHDDPKIADGRFRANAEETVPAIRYLKETGTHVVDVSSEVEGEEGWMIFKDALLALMKG
ncbi:MAG: hypothetical protein Q9169_007114 [Polycauliona sp. 2 TL-2023]